MSDILHNPGGKSSFPLKPGITGDAAFSPCGQYRHVLFRERSFQAAQSHTTALFIGMNPSTARADLDDPTVQREQAVAWREGARFFVKVNVMDYRATDPRTLREEGLAPRSTTNLDWIRQMAEAARNDGGFAVAAWGLLHPAFQKYADEALAVLLATKVPLSCLGYTKDGHPRHPLYLQSNAHRRPFPRIDA